MLQPCPSSPSAWRRAREKGKAKAKGRGRYGETEKPVIALSRDFVFQVNFFFKMNVYSILYTIKQSSAGVGKGHGKGKGKGKGKGRGKGKGKDDYAAKVLSTQLLRLK